MSKTVADRTSETLNPNWPAALDGCFEVTVCDEAHVLKSASDNVSKAVLWLQSRFNIMVTAFPIPNGIQDLAGYTRLIEPPMAGKWLLATSLGSMNFDKDENPFAVLDDHLPAK